jgi:hypothetical protein
MTIRLWRAYSITSGISSAAFPTVSDPAACPNLATITVKSIPAAWSPHWSIACGRGDRGAGTSIGRLQLPPGPGQDPVRHGGSGITPSGMLRQHL